MTFTRTSNGLAEKWRFHQVPTIWVEGQTDILFYKPITDKIPCRIEAFNGAENARTLVQALVDRDYPYLVIMDGDYKILSPSRSPHHRVLVLARYSFENFLWEPESVNRACLVHAKCGDNKDLVGPEMQRVAKHLRQELHDAVVLDIAARRSPSPPAVLPNRIDQLFLDHSRPDINPAKVAALVAAVTEQINPKVVKSAQAEVKGFLRERCITHLLNGHLVFGVLRRVFLRAAEKQSGNNTSISNDTLTHILADMVWRRCQSNDHKVLKRAVRTKTRKLISRYPTPP